MRGYPLVDIFLLLRVREAHQERHDAVIMISPGCNGQAVDKNRQGIPKEGGRAG